MHIDGSLSFVLDVGFEMTHVQEFKLANVQIKYWPKYFDFVDHRLTLSPKVLVRSHKTDEGYQADVTYQSHKDDNWYNLALDLVEADIAIRSA